MTIVCLGIEGTAHSFGAGVVTEEGEVLSNIWDMLSPKEGGIHPREASRHHAELGPEIVRRALEEAEVNPRDIGVNHCVAHVEIGCLESGFQDPVTVYVSGGNTQIIAFAGGRFRTFGETLDIAIGNMLDTLGRELGMRFPAGPIVEREARRGKKYYQLPYSVKGMDLSYSGMLTAAKRIFHEGVPLPDVCFSVQETAFGMLAEIAERAIAHTKKSELLLTGGVARNNRLTEILKGVAERHDAEFHRVSPSLAGDQGAMIAWTGILQFKAGDSIDVAESQVLPKWRTDEQDIVWRSS